MRPKRNRFGNRLRSVVRVNTFAIPQTGGVQAIATPYDEDLSKLGSKLGGTYLAYGGGDGAEGDRFRADARKTAEVSETTVADSAPAEARALRSINKAVNAKAYIGDLLQNIENGSVKLESVTEADLPEDLRNCHRLNVSKRSISDLLSVKRFAIR
jgi:hypothetical protein